MDRSIRIAKELVRIARVLVSSDGIPGIEEIKPDSQGRLIAYHGSSQKLNEIKAHTTGAYQNLGNVIFLTKYFEAACGFALTGNEMNEWLESKGIDDWTNFDNNMTEGLKRNQVTDNIDVEIYVTTENDFKEGEVIEKDIYVHSVDIKPYLDKVKDISGHDFEFIVSGVDSIPVVDCKTVKARYRIMKDKIGNAVASLGKFMKSHKFYRSMSKEDYGYEYDLNEKGKELGKIYVNGKHDSDEIEMWVESPQSAIGKKLPSVGLNGFASDGSIKFKDAKKAQDWLKRNADKIEQVLRGNADI